MDTTEAAEKEGRLRLELTYLALLAEKADRFDDVLDAMCSVAKLGNGLTELERKLFSASFNNLIEKKFAVLNLAASFQKAKEKEENEFAVKAAKDYRFKLEKEVKETCCMSMDPFELMKNAKEYGTAAATIVRMEKKEAVKRSLEAQECVWKVAKEKLPATSPVRLDLALEISKTYYKLDSGERAYQLVDEALADAKAELKLKIPSKETRKFMTALKHRLTLLGSIDDGAHKGVRVNLQQQSGWPEGVQLGNKLNLSEDEKLSHESAQLNLSEGAVISYETAQHLSGSCNTSTDQEMRWWWPKGKE